MIDVVLLDQADPTIQEFETGRLDGFCAPHPQAGGPPDIYRVGAQHPTTPL